MGRSAVVDTQRLIEMLDASLSPGDVLATTERIKNLLAELGTSAALQLPERLCRPREECYARRLLHRDERRGYTAVVMTWGPGQSTPLHDHAGIWCVEGVVRGEMDVTRYDLTEERDGLCRFRKVEEVRARVGSSGSLIPPYEYHVLGNALAERPSVTLHVYGGEMDRCCIFRPRDDGWYERVERSLRYYD